MSHPQWAEWAQLMAAENPGVHRRLVFGDDGRLKPRPELLPASALLDCAQVMADGEAEHGERWRTRTPMHHVGAAMRHTLRWLAGEREDASGHSHLAHAATRLLMAVELDREDTE